MAEDTSLIKTLAALNEIGAQVNRLGLGQDLQVTLRLIVENAVRAVAVGADSVAPGPTASAVIWVYDQAQRAFDLNSRVSAGGYPCMRRT